LYEWNYDKFFYHRQGVFVKKDKKFFQGHERLAEERARLWGTQQEAADFFGVSRVTWGQYERGNATPTGDVLAGLAQQGADVLYILTGQRNPNPSTSRPSPPQYTPPPPTAEERALLSDFRTTDAQGKRIIRATASAAARAVHADTPAPGRHKHAA